jgi:hypothetical protein
MACPTREGVRIRSYRWDNRQVCSSSRQGELHPPNTRQVSVQILNQICEASAERSEADR